MPYYIIIRCLLPYEYNILIFNLWEGAVFDIIRYMTTRREWLRQQRKRKYGKYKGIFIVLGIVLGLAVLAGLTFAFIRWGLPLINKQKPGEVPVSADIVAAAVSEDVPEPAVSADRTEPEPVPEGFSLKVWKKEHTPVKGIYVTGPVAGSERMAGLIELLDKTELNAMVIDIKNDGGEVTFKMPEDTQPAQMGNCVRYIRDIEELMRELKEHEIYTIARIVCFKDPMLAAAAPELALIDTDGKAITDSNDLAWVNPCQEGVWAYITDIALYCADLGFDEVQFDYVRFPVGKGTEKADYKTEVTEENKHEFISGFLNYAAERLHEKEVPITADLFGTVIGNPTDVGKVGQDYVELASTVDVLCPMIYPSHYGNGVFGLDIPDAQPYDTVIGALGLSARELSGIEEEKRAVVRPWLQDFTATWVKGHISYGPEEVQDQIKGVYDAGYDEWILWNAKNNYSISFEEESISENGTGQEEEAESGQSD